MKLVFYINAIHHGGAERVMVNLANHFADIGCDVVLVTSFRDSWEYTPSKKVQRVSLFENVVGNFIVRNIKLTLALRALLKKEKPSSLISFMAEPNFRAIVASFGMAHRKIISVRNDPNKEYPNIIYRIFAKLLYHFANHIVFQTEDARKWFPTSIQQKSSIILNPVDESFFKIKFNGQRHDIITTGRLVPQKNHELLIRAFAKIADKIDDNLYIYGEGGLRSKLEKLVCELNMQNRIFLPGAVKNVANTIKCAKLFVLSSDYEGMPNSLMEAMAMEIPCISTDCPCGGPRMLLNDNFLCNLKDEKKLSILMMDVVKKNRIQNNYRCNTNKFKIENNIKEWLNILN